ncbi:unnamed protein product [Cutaneotrichosporon oleaginosum]
MTSVLFVDDFDPLVVYSNYDDWQTPNPQDNPMWWNASADVTNSPWHQATYHYTEVQGARAAFNFTGSSISVYGATGPTTSSYTVTIDGNVNALQVSNSTGRTVLYEAHNLTSDTHQLEIVNSGSGLLLDAFAVRLKLGGEDATLSNTTLDDRAPEIKYEGQWTQQQGPNFHAGTSTYTSGPGNAMMLNFTGSAIYVYGDQVNDHGDYTVSLNGSTVGRYSGRSGCRGGFAKACEKLHGLVFFAGDLPAGSHALRIENGGPAEGNKTFFDFDYLDYTVPSVYATRNQSSDGVNTASSSNPAAPRGTTQSSDAASAVYALLWGVLAAWAVKAFL